MKVKALIESGNDGSYGVYVDLEDKTLNYGIIGDGKTVKEALDDFYNSYKEMQELYKSENKYFKDAEFEFKYDTASFLAYYSNALSLAGLERLTGIAQGQLSHYVTGRPKPNQKTIQEIETSLHKFAGELSQVQLV
jgi:predicted RNase H-like HicB family nuclease